MQFLDKHKLINENQYGFREGYCTENSLCKVTSDIFENIYQGNKVIDIFLDLAKAFDTVAHQILCTTTRGITNNIFKFY